MTRRIAGLLFLSLSLGVVASTTEAQAAPVKPPVAPVRPVTDDYFGSKVVDNYRYMENLNDPEVQSWFKNQDASTRATLASIPGRDKLLARIRELFTSLATSVIGVQRVPGDRYFYRKLLAGERVPKLYMRTGLSGAERLLVDPENVKVAPSNRSKGRNVLAYVDISQDGKYAAVGIMPGGSENDTEIHVVDVATGHETGDVVLRAPQDARGANPQWLPDNRSFVYGRLQDLPLGAPKTELLQKGRTYLHVLGTDPQKDPAVFGYGVVPAIDVDPRHEISVSASPGSKYVIGRINPGVSPNSSYYIEPVDAVGTSYSAWRKLADLSDKVRSVAVHGDDLYLLTFKNASRYKILRTDARQPDLSSAEVVVPPSDAVVESMSAAQDALYVQVLDGGIDRILRVPYGAAPKVEHVVLPLEGTATPVGSDPRVPGILLRLASWTDQGNLYSYDPRTRRLTNTQLAQPGPFTRDENSEVVNVKAKSYDGTLVPLSITYPKGIKLDGSHPTLLLGYGAYGTVTIRPAFAGPLIAWTERGGILAECGTRGGGEYGEDWHLAGKGPTKPNTWRDFIACAQYLVDKKFTSPAHLAGQGRSAGGILIGRAITERPDLFGAALMASGLLDALRSETTANGVGNIQEFGSTKTEEGFRALYAMSAYHHVQDRTPYPAVLLTVGINDPRVDPWESAKMAARLQAATSSGKPVLLRVDYAGGHGGIGSTIQQVQESLADSWSFLLWQLGDPEFQPVRRQVTPLADSVIKLGHAGLWDRASQLAQASYDKTTSLDERCALLVHGADALIHTGRLETAGGRLETFDRQCSAVASAGRYASTIGDLQREVSLPPLPVTGVDFSGVDQFWRIADILTRDVEPTDAEWRSLFSSVGYRLVMRRLSTTKSDLEIALRPSRRAAFDSVPDKDSSKVRHLARAMTHRAELARYRDSVSRALPVQHAVALASRFLPPHTTDGETPPLVAFALFSPDAYSVGPQALVIDLDQVYGAGGLTELLAHEFHHSYVARLSNVRFPAGDDPSAALVRALGNARNEGIADLIDKPYPLSVRHGSGLETYAKRYNDAYARTPQVIRSIDSALVVAADDSTKLRDVGRRVQQLLPAGGHFNGSYMAREIYETFGVDSLYPAESNMFAFWRAYAEAEAKRGNPAPYSPKAVALLDGLEKKYVRR